MIPRWLVRLLPESRFAAWKRGFDEGLRLKDEELRERVASERVSGDSWQAIALSASATLDAAEARLALLQEERNFYRDLAMLSLDISEKTLRLDE